MIMFDIVMFDKDK